MRHGAALGVLLVLGASCAPARSPGATLDEASRNRVLRHLQVLAADETEGRGLGEPGLEKATAYAARALEEAGALPGWLPAGLPASYLQPVPLVRYRYGAGNHLTLRKPDGERNLVHGADLLVLHPGRDLPTIEPAPLVFVGCGISEPEQGWDDYADLDVRGRLVVVMEGTPPGLPPAVRELHADPLRGPERRYASAVQQGVAGLVVIPVAEAFAQWNLLMRSRIARSFAATRYYTGGTLEDPELPVVAVRKEILDGLFEGSGYDPVMRAGEYRTFELEGVAAGLTLDVMREPFESHNVVGLVPGSDEDLEGELVVLSAHVDHLGMLAGEIHNGANDDASGCAVVLEVARLFAADPPARGVLFVLFTAEETDHLGSLHFLAEPPVPGAQIVAGLNLEHVGRSLEHVLLATASPELDPTVRRVQRRLATRRLRSATLDRRGQTVAGSDSYSFFLHGIPLVIVGGGLFPEYHTPDDDLRFIEPGLLADATAITIELLREIAGERLATASER